MDIKNTLETSKITLEYLGLFPRVKNSQNFYYTTYGCFVVFLIASFSLSHIIHAFTTDDFNDLANSVGWSVITLQTLYNIAFHLKDINVAREMLNQLEFEVFQPRMQSHRNIISQATYLWKIGFGLYVCGGTIITLSFAVVPLVQKSNTTYELPFNVWIPFTFKYTPVYEILYGLQIVALTLTAVTNFCISMLFDGFMLSVSSQCAILCYNLRNIKQFNNNDEDFFIEYGNKFIACIHHHQAILRFAQLAQRYGNMPVTGLFFFLTISFCMGWLRLSLTPISSANFVAMAIYISGITYQLALNCWFGNEVIAQSSEIPRAIMDSDWLGALQLKKQINFFIMRSQKPIEFKGLGLLLLSFEAFKTVMKSSWSYYAVMKQVNDRR